MAYEKVKLVTSQYSGFLSRVSSRISNISKAQEELLLGHLKLGHYDIRYFQHLITKGALPVKVSGVEVCNISMYWSCVVGKRK